MMVTMEIHRSSIPRKHASDIESIHHLPSGNVLLTLDGHLSQVLKDLRGIFPQEFAAVVESWTPGKGEYQNPV